MIVPIVVIGDIVGFGFIFHTLQVALAVIPEVVVRVGDISRLFGIQCTITLYLIPLFTSIAIEEVAVMYPDMVVALLQAAVIAFRAVAVHEAQIPNFNVRAVLHNQTKAIQNGIVADAFNGHASFCSVHIQITLHQNSRVSDIANDSQAERTGFLAFFIGIDDCLYTSYSDIALAFCIQACSNGIFIFIRDIDNNGIRTQCAVFVVCTGRSAFYKAETASVIGFYGNSCFCCTGQFTCSLDRNDFQGVAASFQTQGIRTEMTVFILPNQHAVNLYAVTINIVTICTADWLPFCVSPFKISHGFGDGNTAGSQQGKIFFPCCIGSRNSICCKSQHLGWKRSNRCDSGNQSSSHALFK